MRESNKTKDSFTNYGEQLEWFNISVKPLIVTHYEATYKPVTPVSPISNNVNNTSNETRNEGSRPTRANTNPTTTTAMHSRSNSPTDYNKSTVFERGNSNKDTAPENGFDDFFSNERTIINDSYNNTNNNTTSYSNTSFNNSRNNSNNNNSDNFNRKRTASNDDNLTIDLTNSQPKRSKPNEPSSMSAASSKSETLDQYVPYEQRNNFCQLDDDLIEEFGQDDEFGPDDHIDFVRDWDEEDDDLPANTTSHAMDGDDGASFISIDEEALADLDNMSVTPQQKLSKEELRAVLESLTDQLNKLNADIAEALDNDVSPEQMKSLRLERAKVKEDMQQTEEQIANYDNVIPVSPMQNTSPIPPAVSPLPVRTPPSNIPVVVVDDDDDRSAQVSPFFAKPSVPTPVVRPPITATPIATNNSQPTYPWSRDVRKALTQSFKLTEFRPNQLEAINTTLNGEDVFVLMPTGGGKSLCYQLPAIIQMYKRQGVTFVVSPLISLMQDQVEQLVEGKGIAAGMLNGTVKEAQKRWIFSDLNRPTPSMNLLYITPELLLKSSHLRDVISNLHKRNKLARFVIDEAHCVSQWGHDFRPDYKQLGFLKQTYPDVPIMALTATANEPVQKDVLNNLHITDCKVLRQSFNRTNLIYQVVPKVHKQVLADIQKFVNDHRNQSGIIYCCTKKDCEKVAEELRNNYRVSIKHYHAAMSTEERSVVQREWQTGRIQVIAATIAFGMGIDKPDVRFVAHYSIPSSLEGYYQETGRAGRDGLPATCRLYFNFSDTKTHNFLIDKGDGNWEQKQRQRENLSNMMRFCDNETDCRRKQIMSYFGERFQAAMCNKMCDNCIRNQYTQNEFKDMTQDAAVAIKIIQQLGSDTVTLNQLLDIYRGAKLRRVMERGHDRLTGFGHGKNVPKINADRLLRAIVYEGGLEIKTVTPNNSTYPVQEVHIGPKSNLVLNGSLKINISFTPTGAPAFSNDRVYNSSASASVPAGFVSAGSMVGNNRSLSNGNVGNSASTSNRRQLPNLNAAAAAPRRKEPADPQTRAAYRELQQLRNSIMSQYNIKNATSVLSDTSLKQIATKLPINEREFIMVTSMKEESFEKWGQQFLNISIRFDNAKHGRS